jgi:hypothetical protein
VTRTPSEPPPIAHIGGSGPQTIHIAGSGPQAAQVAPSGSRVAPSGPAALAALDPNVSGELLVPAPAGGNRAARRSRARRASGPGAPIRPWHRLTRPATLALVGGSLIAASVLIAWLTT